ncbi:SRPBCC family protein [Nocardia sp. NPDC051030]|uniref:SRPBCC family protein n=1 Tax=Nocardia sp. NPDC051030 TaxID=3155162 RepID=UPI0034269406
MLNTFRLNPGIERTKYEAGQQDRSSRIIAAPPERLYDLVSDITQMGRWSPENRGGRWIGGASGPVAGAYFIGFNRRGPVVWATPCQVTVADRGRRFEFDVYLIGARWGYLFEPCDGGTRVTEYRDWPYSAPLMKLLRWTGPLGRPRDNLALDGLQKTLVRLQEIAEKGGLP